MNNFVLNNPGKTLKNLNVIFLSLISGQIMFFLIALFLVQSGQFQELSDLSTIFMYIVPIVNVVLILAAKFIYEKRISKLNKDASLEIKLQSYSTSNIIKLALLESANLINLIIMILTGNYFFAGFFVIITALNFLNKPSVEKFVMEYELSPEDAMKVIAL